MTSNLNVAHAWAHGIDKHHYGSNMHHDNGRLYSYSTCIGQRILLGEKTIFITNSFHYSSSTSKHQGYMNGAIPRNDKNIYVFNIRRNQRGAWELLWLGHAGKKDQKQIVNQLLRFGFYWLAEDYADCVGIKKCNKLDNGFNRSGFRQFVKWLEVTESSTISKLLKLSGSKLLEYARASFSYDLKVDAKKFKTFFRLLAENTDDEKIVDAINGKGTWSDYLERTKGFRLARKMRRITKVCGYASVGWDNEFTSVHGRLMPQRIGSITSKTYQKLQKAGNLITGLYAIKKENIEYAIKVDEVNQRRSRKNKLADAWNYIVDCVVGEMIT